MIGDPIGRSAGNLSKNGARRRFTEAERLQTRPSLDESVGYDDYDESRPALHVSSCAVLAVVFVMLCAVAYGLLLIITA